MFSGIVEALAPINDFSHAEEASRISVSRPSQFKNLKTGDSISVNGVCLTVEMFTDETMQFCLGPETLKVTGWDKNSLQVVNLERSLQLGDRLNGHLVTGHIDAMGEVVEVQKMGESLGLKVTYPPQLASLIWQKGSVCINGVSLTINEVTDKTLSVCLIPETIERTNLKNIKAKSLVTLEVDNFARGWLRMKEMQKEAGQ